KTKRVDMSGRVTSPTRRGAVWTAGSRSIAALALVLAAAACGSSSTHASPKAPVKSTTAPTTAVKKLPPSTTRVKTAAGSIKLVREAGVTPVQLQRAERLIASTIS